MSDFPNVDLAIIAACHQTHTGATAQLDRIHVSFMRSKFICDSQGRASVELLSERVALLRRQSFMSSAKRNPRLFFATGMQFSMQSDALVYLKRCVRVRSKCVANSERPTATQ